MDKAVIDPGKDVTREELPRLIKPDILAKSGDQARDAAVGFHRGGQKTVGRPEKRK